MACLRRVIAQATRARQFALRPQRFSLSLINLHAGTRLLKRKIKSSLSSLDELSIAFDYEGEVTAQDAQEILDKIYRMYGRSLEAAEATNNPERVEALRLFAANLQKAFYGFEPDFFQQNLLRIVDDVVSVIKGSIELWPSLVEICYFQKDRKGLPQIRVKNRKIR
jgi:flagellin-specific chaperone FliS